MNENDKPAAPALLRRRPILVTGAAGFIGSNLADRFAREGHDVLVYDTLAPFSLLGAIRRTGSPCL